MSLEKDIENIVKSYGARLYDIESLKENDENIYRVSIVKDGGVDLKLCTDISKDLSPLLDVTPAMDTEYRLEVSSPGIERKLTKLNHFKNSIGEKIKFKILGEGKDKGILVDANDEGIKVETKDGIKEYKYTQLGTVKTYFDW